MRIFLFLRALFTSEAALLPTVFAGTSLIVSFLVGLLTEKRELFPALTVPLGGACLLVISGDGRFTDGQTAAFVGAYVFTGGAIFLSLRVLLAIRFSRRRRKAERRERERRLAFALPDKENSFLRDRLNGRLKPSEAKTFDFFPSEAKLSLSHAQKLLSKVKASPLAPADRLETQSLARRLTGLADRERLTKEEFSTLNDCLSELIKTAAKYAV